jgi:iron complex outermembrane recepter protein
MHLHFSILFMVAATHLAPAAEPARPRADPAAPPVVLSPFAVSADSDLGYQATSTLAGSRFKTDLKDTAASIAVLTSEFLSDTGATTLTDALRYSVSAQPDLADASADGPNPSGSAVQGAPAEFRVRGQTSSRARNFFALTMEVDTYNLERIEESRGPNSVLFGFGAPGGILNVSTKQARLDRPIRHVTAEAGSFGSHRETVDFNEVLLRGKLALRLNALHGEARTFQQYAFTRDRRFDLAVSYRPDSATQVRAEFERTSIKANKARPFSLMDGGILGWQKAGSPTFATAVATNPAFGITRRATARRLMFIGNNQRLIEVGGTLVTTDTDIAILGRSSDPTLQNPEVNYGGPGQIAKTGANDLSVFLERKFGRRTFLELGYNRQDHTTDGANPGQTNMKLFADPNRFLADGQPNPYVGRYFIENSSNSWERNTDFFRSQVLRATLSTELEAGRWGNYRVATLGERDRRAAVNASYREYLVGAPFNGAPENSVNQVRRRNYVTLGDWSTFYINSPLTTGLINGVADPVTGRTLSTKWIVRGQTNAQDDPSTQKTGLVSGQARYFGNRLVLGAGYRYDNLEILDRTAQRSPLTNEFSTVYGTTDRVERTVRNTTFGVVAHVTPQVSLFYNRANNEGLGVRQPIIDIDNLLKTTTSPNSKGKGTDYGLALALLDGKINLRTNYYTTDSVSQSASYGVGGIGPNSVAKNILGALQAAGRITLAQQDAHTTIAEGVTFDMSSKGYELVLTANPTKNWRLQTNYSYTDTARTNFGPEVKAWMNQEIAYWKSFNQGGLITGGGNTIDAAIAFMLDGYNTQANIEGVGELGNRKHKVNVFTRYDLPGETLKGAHVGGGYRHQSRNLAGTNAASTIGYYGKSFWRAELMAGYRFQTPALRRAGGWLKALSLQLNVDNVFNDRDELITRILEDGVSIRRAVVQEPRTWRLVASLDF